jgi:predicted PolB exonuclease-like 3'-5' exonuclease
VVARTPSAEYLVLDIETIPDTERWKRPDVTEGTQPAGARSVAGAFPPAWAHRVVVIGCLWLDHGYRLKRLGVVGDPTGGEGTPDQRERALLEDFSRFVGRARPVLVTYNGRAFDLPVIALRALCHGTPLAWYYRERNVRYRYSEEGHLDLCDWLADHGATRSGSLDAVARLIGLPGKVGIDGSQVEGLYHAGQLEEIQRYCLSDVAQTALLFLRFRLLQGVLRPEQYQEVTSALLDALAADGRVGSVLDGADRAHLLGPTPSPAPASSSS